METYNEILERMKENFLELSGFLPDDASDLGIRLRVLAGEIFSLNNNVQWLKNQMFANTAVGNQLELHAEQRGLSRKSAVKSLGTLTFSREEALDYDVEIPEGTICATADVDGVRFETLQDAVLCAGDLSVNVNARSLDGGKDKNVLANKITVMVTPPAGITSVNNSAAFTGGVDEETDAELRSRILESYKNISNGTNIAFYKNEVLKYDGVYSVSVVPIARGVGTVDIYVAGKGELLSNSLINTIQNGIDELREINLDIQVKSPTLVTVNTPVSIEIEDGYLFSEVREECLSVIDDYYKSLSIGQQVIFAAIGDRIFNINGVKNYSFGSTVDFDKEIDVDELAVKGTVVVQQKS